ncbi:hypothetical protein [Mycoplasmopsis glycophila]|nr:hypothetical protein [Mycoplasmopsis glycophila]
MSFYKNVFLYNKNKYLMNFFLSFESNVRWSSIFGFIGIKGIGEFFKMYEKQPQHLGITIFVLVLVLFIIEIFLFILKNYLFVPVALKTSDKSTIYKWKYIYKSAIKLFLLIFLVGLIIYSVVDLILKVGSSKIVDKHLLYNFWNTYWKFDFSDIVKDPSIYLIYWSLFKQTFVAISFGFFGAIFYAYFASDKLHKPATSLFLKFLLSVFKAIPTLILFFIINPLFSTKQAYILILSFGAFKAIVKQLIESVGLIKSKELEMHLNLGWTKPRFYLNYILPKIWRRLIGYMLFEFEGTYRNAINYSLFVGIGVYGRINNKYIKEDAENKIIPYLLPCIIFFFLIEFIFLVKKERWIFKIMSWWNLRKEKVRAN